MSLPSVTAVMLTNGTRPKMEERAIQCFQHQIYERKNLLIVDSGSYRGFEESYSRSGAPTIHKLCVPPDSLGELRNSGNEYGSDEIIVHWDDDDWSDPSRITEQVRFLMASGAEAVGYHTMLFWDSRPNAPQMHSHLYQGMGGAWRYRSPNPNYCLGSSLMYWREVWERHPFPAKNTGEDTEWLLRIKAQGVTSIGERPRMVCAIHGANTSSEVKPGSREWSRAAAYDKFCAEVMGL